MNSDSNSFVLDEILKNPDRRKAYLDLAQEYMSRDQSFRDMVTQGWNFNVPWEFPNRRRLASTKGEIDSPEIRIRAVLLFFSIAEKGWLRDVRDILVGLAFCYHSCLAAGIDPDKMFRAVAEVSTPKIREILIGFIERSEDNKSMKAFKLVRTDGEDGEIIIELH